MSIKDKEIHDTLITSGMLPKTISMEDCMKLLRTLKAEMEIQHYKEMEGMLSIEEGIEVLNHAMKSTLSWEDKAAYLASFITSKYDPDTFQNWDNIVLDNIEKQKQASQPSKK